MIVGSVPISFNSSVNEQLSTLTVNANKTKSTTTSILYNNDNDEYYSMKRRLLIERSLQTSPSSVVPIPDASCSTTSPTCNETNTNRVDAIPDASTTGPTTGSENTTVIMKPFFIMDWLEEIDPKSMALAQRMLQQQQKQESQSNRKDHIPVQSNRLQPKNESLTIDQQVSNEIFSFNKESSICAGNSTSSRNDTSCTSRDDSLPLLPQMDNNCSEANSIRNHFIPVMDIATRISSESPQTQSCTSESILPSAASASAVTTVAATTSPFLQHSIRIGNIYNTKGIQQARNGNWNKALHYWFNALEIRLQIYNDNTSMKHIDIANTYNNIGIAYGKIEQYDNAIQYLQMALEIRMDHYSNNTTTTTTDRRHHQQQQQLLMDIATTLHNIGNIYQQQNQLSTAIQYYIQCKVLQEEMVLVSHNNNDDDDDDDCDSSISNSSVSITNQIEIARTCIAIGHTYAMAHAYSDAYEAYYDAIVIFEKVNGMNSISDEINNNNNNKHCYSYHEYTATLNDLQSMKEKMNSK